VTKGWYCFLEEVLGMWLPLRLAKYWIDRGVAPPRDAILWGYQVVAIFCGAVFAVVVSHFGRLRRVPLIFGGLLILNAGFFHYAGYVENYGLATLLLSTGFIVATDSLFRDQITWVEITVVNILFTAAVASHGVSVWSILALVFFAVIGAYKSYRTLIWVVVINILLSALILGGLYMLFSQYLTPGIGTVHIERKAFLLTWSEMASHRSARDHLILLFNVGTPAIIVTFGTLLIYAERFVRLFLCKDIWFAILYFLGFLIHQFVWVSKIWLVRDWDLFGFTWLPMAYFAYRAVETAEPSYSARLAVLAISMIAGFSWVLSYARIIV
jgi:hypothetical protein